MSLEEGLLKARIADLEAQVLHIRSSLANVISEIRQAAEEEDYDEIKSLCDDWDPSPPKVVATG